MLCFACKPNRRSLVTRKRSMRFMICMPFIGIKRITFTGS